MLTFDTRDFQREARRMDALASQIPFALAQALNASAEIARKDDLPQAWAEHITARNRSFMRATMSTKGTRATKRNLRVIVYDRLDHANLALHDKGGTRKPRGRSLAVPSDAVAGRRTGKGVPKGLRPRAVPNSFVKGDVLYQRIGKGKDRHLRLMYVFKPSAPIRPDVPFHAAFARSMRRSMPAQFRVAMRKAMATARKTK